ncbi:MAG: DUF488 domain-containing protein [Saprospiraceae bacterium]|nr:DUF488 domain-containing protein [Saprospiraceae bacterium]
MDYQRLVFTIGHSNHDFDFFLNLLQQHRINCLVDVRSVAASTYNPQYNQLPLKNALNLQHIIYLHFKDEFGARQEDELVLDEEGLVRFEFVQRTPIFKRGVNRLENGLEKGYRIALMCSEADPLDCHRFSMIARYLVKEEIEIFHILKDGTLRSHQALEQDLLKKYEKKLPQPSLFAPQITAKDKLQVAYQLHNQEIGWRVEQ